VLFEAGQAAGFSQYQLTRYLDTIQTDRCIIHLATNGHTNSGMAELMGTSEGTLRYRRQRIRPLLQHLFPPGAVVQHDRSGGNQERVRANQLTCPDQQWSCLQCTNRFP
jgi:hypothetical protein